MYGIFTYIWLIFMINVGKYTSPMDPMGNIHGFPVRAGNSGPYELYVPGSCWKKEFYIPMTDPWGWYIYQYESHTNQPFM